MSPRTGPADHAPADPSVEVPDKFLTDYYELVADDDLRNYTAESLRNRAEYHRSLAATRGPGKAVIGVLSETDASIVAIVAEDMPYLLPSITAALARDNAAIRWLVHPTFTVARARGTNRLVDIQPVPLRTALPVGNEPSAMPSRPESTGDLSCAEAWIAVEIARLPDQASADRLTLNLQAVLADVRAAAEDSAAIHRHLTAEIADLDASAAAASDATVQETKDLLLWLYDGNFLFLGYRGYGLDDDAGLPVLAARPGSGLGLLRHREQSRPLQGSAMPGPPGPALALTKASIRSTVLRDAYLDEVSLLRFDAAGNPTREACFVGLFAPGAASRSVLQIPVIRDKVATVLDRFGFPPGSQAGKELLAAIEAYPRDELFHIDADDLAGHTREILRLQERHSTRLFLRPDSYGRFMSALVFLPRRRYSTAVRLNIERELREAFNSKAVEFELRLSESAMARVFFRILLAGGGGAAVDASALELRIIAATRSWAEGLDEALQARFPVGDAARLSMQWARAFPASYKADYEVEDAVEDIIKFESLDGPGGRNRDDPLLSVYARPGTAVLAEDARIRLYLTRPQSLTQILPFFHNLGLEVLDQRPFDVRRADGRTFFLYDLGLKYPSGVDPLGTSELLADAFCAAMRGDIESDTFDALVIREGIGWRQTAILRGYAKYLQQLGTTNSYGFMADTLRANVRATRALLALFEAKFDPDLDQPTRLFDMDSARSELTAAIDAVPVLDADRLLRSFASLVEATLRTNYFLDKPYLSFKLNLSGVPVAPAPRPKYEIWVYSPRVEGVHLRFGAIARGGLRWSDRREDFRTEILGLVKAQTVKNAVIVPTGAKGGFYPKRLPDAATDRAAWLAEGQESYRIFIRGMLDITDNLLPSPDGAHGSTELVVPPERVVRHDGDDYYLVVAADKGTAAFSDIANALALEYGFWLGDAFASGGSVGYDHKQMGITARGAWESVRHHFSELLIDSTAQDFTVVGIGDMSGDVFGNGMLLSRHILLVAAFDHRHIFLDPNPDPAVAYAERQRLFGLPRSSWADYDVSKISPGGGVFSRLEKSIEITEAVRRALGLEPGTTAMSPPELLRAVLRAPVDLLYNGGIGTYVKASTETHSDVGDKTNDAIRVNASQLRTRIIAEGGNLGITQRGRIEAALGGVLLNTDAIDNSAGVECSDHEVNIKIFLDRMIAAGRMSQDERTGFLHSLQEEVGRLVLRTNADQNVLLLNDRQLVLHWSPSFERTMDWLEAVTDLDRNLECLPSTEQLHTRLQTGAGLTSPELSVLAAYAKIELARELTLSGLADDPWFARTLRDYFPRQLSERFGDELSTHPLRQQIVATVIANDMINLGGVAFAFRAMEETTVSAAAVARGFVVMRKIWDFDSIAEALSQLPASIPSEHGCAVALDMRRTLDRSTRWYVNHDFRDKPIADAMARLGPPMSLLRPKFSSFLHGVNLQHVMTRLAHTDAVGLPHELGVRASEILVSYGLLDITAISEELQEPADTVAEVYFAVFERISAVPILEHITALPRETHWQALARAALRDDLYLVLAGMTKAVVRTTPRPSAPGTDPVERIVVWERENIEQLGRIQETIKEAIKPGPVDIAALSVAVKLLRALVSR
ncbi:glutamate dehydrogenase [Arthrobacter sp. PvP023]|uniref:NAD-glutamate dehydrogenase n=1 Tax=Micrococcaceae TaxID=1268 RepID=UPI001AEACAE5|nr:NAD-glutamate dehydrogenase [Arthrobacter sp. PvP023]MBP1136432.1 glutamate dehydrogenase [Arthrobacter sp. PvP023]